ncbi:helix-turn-helix domain-containing protein, partial [Brytella acorum]|uniref:helix-turn-helix domain-containing protein n=1 Tax=Brytella acorum TaxID=2959299 RepID=UPI0037445E95
MSPAQAAQVTDVSRWTIMRAIKSGDLQAFRDNKNQWRIKTDDLNAWLSAHPAQCAHT